MENKQLIRAWAFYRRSTDKQEVSVDVQRTECRNKATQLGAEIVQEFAPSKGYASGLTIDRDPIFKRMVALAEMPDHDVRYLFVYSVSRFGRLEVEDKIYWDRRFKRAGVQVIYVMDDFKNDGSIGDVVTKVVAHSEAHEYSMKLSAITLRGCLEHAKQGRSCGGSAPYGYARMLVDAQGQHQGILADGRRKADKTQRIVWVVGDPSEVSTVHRIFSMFARDNGVWRIVNMLNRENIPSPRGKKWSKSMVTYMLQNEAYLGTKIYNQRDYKNWRRGNESFWKPREEWVIRQNSHPAIIDQGLYDAVQKRRGKRKPRSGRPYYSPYLLSALLKCSCGHNYQGIPKYHAGKKTSCYTCGGYHNKGKFVCGGLTFPCAPVESYILGQIDRVLQQIRTKVRLKEYLERTIGSDLRGDCTAIDLDQIANEIMAEVHRADQVLQDGTPEARKQFVAGFLHEGLVKLKDRRIDFRFYKIPFIQKEVTERLFASPGGPNAPSGNGDFLDPHQFKLT